MKRFISSIFFIIFTFNCNSETLTPDASIPKCKDVGCPDSAFCTQNGSCVCIPHPGDNPIRCEM